MPGNCFRSFCEIWRTNQKRDMIWGLELCSTWDISYLRHVYLRQAVAVVFYLRLVVDTSEYLRQDVVTWVYIWLVVLTCLHVIQVETWPIQMWAQVTKSFWMCNPQLQLFTCNSLQRLSRKTNTVQGCQYRKITKIVCWSWWSIYKSIENS